MKDALRMDAYEDVLDLFQAQFPDKIGTTPQWPRYDVMSHINDSVNAVLMEYNKAVFEERDLVKTAAAITAMMTVLIGTAVTLGIDLRPVWAAVHKARLSGSEADIKTLLELQEPLRAAEGPKGVT